MAEQRKAASVRADDTEAQERMAREAFESLPPPGHERREQQRRRADNLEREVDSLAAKVLTGRLDGKNLQIQNEIAHRTKYLAVSNPDPNYCYAWISKNSHGHHIMRMEQLGYRVVQGDDPEAAEYLPGGPAAGAGSVGTTRELADVILMKIPRDRYILLRALERAKVVQMHESSGTGNLQSLIDRHRRHVRLHNAPQTADYEELGGPAVHPQTFTQHPRSPFGRRRASIERLDRHLRAGTLPGMEIQRPA